MLKAKVLDFICQKVLEIKCHFLLESTCRLQTLILILANILFLPLQMSFAENVPVLITPYRYTTPPANMIIVSPNTNDKSPFPTYSCTTIATAQAVSVNPKLGQLLIEF